MKYEKFRLTPEQLAKPIEYDWNHAKKMLDLAIDRWIEKHGWGALLAGNSELDRLHKLQHRFDQRERTADLYYKMCGTMY